MPRVSVEAAWVSRGKQTDTFWVDLSPKREASVNQAGLRAHKKGRSAALCCSKPPHTLYTLHKEPRVPDVCYCAGTEALPAAVPQLLFHT